MGNRICVDLVPIPSFARMFRKGPPNWGLGKRITRKMGGQGNVQFSAVFNLEGEW